MFFIIGFIVVVASVIGGYVLHHGNLGILWQPTEFLIIGGAGIGSFLISNQPKTVTGSLKRLKGLLKGAPYKKASYIELLTFLFVTLRLMRTKGMLAVESHIENPHESSLFSQFPGVHHNNHAVDFICDYLRLMTMGIDNPYQIEDLMTAELDVHHKEAHTQAGAIQTLGDAFPALGIVAAVLGVIITMGSITEPPEVLGHLIGAALVGTFFGILLSYGFVAPMGKFLDQFAADEHTYIECIKAAILSHLKGNAPVISVEYARKCIGEKEKPTFIEVEEACNNAPAAE
ncbi:MAG: flagellar motor stator protein MotA [Alphaproteobacteria bacterium]|nr:flagellar motor stator protein MotA [Alphaproteobacteria bacterium]